MTKTATEIWRTKNPKRIKELAKNWRVANPGKQLEFTRNWRIANPERTKELNKKYLQTEKGIQANRRRRRKHKGLGWILMFPNPFTDSVEVDYHHILGAYIVAVPRDLHRLYCGKYHKENLRPILKQIYLGD